MRNLPLPSRVTARSDLEAALQTYRYGGQVRGYAATAAEIDSILALYDSYDSARGAPLEALRGDALGRNLVLAVRDSYDLTQRGRRLEHIRTAVFGAIPLCPLCGIEAPVELDHYLPISLFNPLSIYPRNLVPLCHDCNFVKLAGIVDGDKEYVHAYFDVLPDTRFIEAVVHLRGSAMNIEFRVNDTPALTNALRSRLESQLRALELNARYARELNKYLSAHALTFHTHFDSAGADGVSGFLRLQSRYEVEQFHRNHWRPVLLDALAGCADFCEGGFNEVFPVPEAIKVDLLTGRMGTEE